MSYHLANSIGLKPFVRALPPTNAALREVAVGTIITDRPPHKTVLAQLTHTVPTLEQRSEACGLFALAA